MIKQEILERFHTAAHQPRKLMDEYLAQGKKIVLMAPVYTPAEIVHSMGLIPMGAWGADIELSESKRYFPSFICSIVQSIVELGIRGTYEGASAIVIPSLCDSLKVLGENWKYAVTTIPFIPMTYPQNRRPSYARDFTEAGYRRVIADLEKAAGAEFSEEKLSLSIKAYNDHDRIMRALSEQLIQNCTLSAQERSDVFKSAFFMTVEEHTKLVGSLLDILKEEKPSEKGSIPILTTGILCDAPELLKILDENGLSIAADDVAAESRQYRTDAPEDGTPLQRLASKFSNMGCCSLLYDPQKTRILNIVENARSCGAKGVLMVLTKFCDPEEFDYPLIRRACEAAGLPCIQIEIDRQMQSFEQARTAIETFKDLLEA